MIQSKWQDVYKSWSDMAVMVMVFYANAISLSAEMARMFWDVGTTKGKEK